MKPRQQVSASGALECDKRQIGRFWSGAPRRHVKICGVKNIDIAFTCMRLGVSAVGVHAVGGLEVMERIASWRWWLSVLPSELSVFLLTASEEPEELRTLAWLSNCDTVQLQGNKDIEIVKEVSVFLRSLGLKVVKSLGMDMHNERSATDYVGAIAEEVDAVILDATTRGGSGRTHDWIIARTIVERAGVPIVLAGGLSPANVRVAIEIVRPYGVDVETGVEESLLTAQGHRISVKSFQKIGKLMDEVSASSPSSAI